MSEKPSTQSANGNVYAGYLHSRMPYGGGGSQQFNGGERMNLITVAIVLTTLQAWV
jgi:hypothetical protein